MYISDEDAKKFEHLDKMYATFLKQEPKINHHVDEPTEYSQSVVQEQIEDLARNADSHQKLIINNCDKLKKMKSLIE